MTTPNDLEICKEFESIRKNPLWQLFYDEMCRCRNVTRAWGDLSSFDPWLLLIANSIARRALYLSFPLFIPNTIPKEQFLRKGSNSRIHVYRGASQLDTVRLEATCGYRILEHQFFVAISVQYMTDPIGNSWQVFRPCIILDPFPYRLLYGFEHSKHPDSLFSLLGSFVNLGMHDYVHGSVMKWFPPPEHRQFTDEYRSIHSEATGPLELNAWHACEAVPLPAQFGSDVLRSEILPLEFYSFVVHRRVMDRVMFDASLNYEIVRSSALFFGKRLATLLKQDRVPIDVATFFLALAARFLVCCMPIEKTVKCLSEAFPRSFRESVEDYLSNFLSTAHGGLFRLIHDLDGQIIPWGGQMSGTDIVGSTYLAGVSQYAAEQVEQDINAIRSLYGESVDEVPRNFYRLAISALKWLKLRDSELNSTIDEK